MKEVHGQVATEYLIILSGIVIVALVAAGVLGIFPQISVNVAGNNSIAVEIAGTGRAQENGEGIGIADYRVLGTTAYLTIKNYRTFPVRVTDIKLDGTGSIGSQVLLAPGSQARLRVVGIRECIAGKSFSYDIMILYWHQESGRAFEAGGRLTGTCA